MSRMTRRRALQTGSAMAAATIVSPHVLGGARHVAPSDRVHVALVGAGGRGLRNARELMKLPDVRISVIADPAEEWDLQRFYYKGKAGRLPVAAEIERHYQQQDPKFRVRLCADYRRLFEEGSSDDFDAVLCATPDHLHAHVSVTAMRARKHVYCEKPLTHNISEAFLVAEVARNMGVATQMGNQGHSRDTIRQTVEWLQGGVLGDVREVHAWVPATRWNPTLQAVPTETQPVPKGLDWDLWCGPRQPVGFHSAYAPVSWRDFWSFGCGAMGDFGCHDLDSAVWALDLDLPERVEMHGAGRRVPGMAPYGEIGYFDFAAKGKRGPVRVHWYSGGLQPRWPDLMRSAGDRLPRRGVLFVGEKGILVCQGAGGPGTLYPESLREAASAIEPTLPRSKGHHRDWIDAIKDGPPASSHFEYAWRLTAITLLGVLALQTDHVIEWNSERNTVISFPEAEPIIRGSYRRGWELQ